MLKIDRVTKVYKVGTFGGDEMTAVRDVSFDVNPGEVISLIGESGSGKTTVGRMILRLASVSGGSITYNGVDISTLKGRKLKSYYADVQGVFQDPFSSYNPIFKADRVFKMIKDAYFPGMSKAEWRSKLGASLEAVTLDPVQVLNKFPHQLSGGQLQRLLIARALLLDIRILIADEIISMLDASTRIDVLNLLGELKSRGLGIIFITHDLSLGNYISEKTVILRRGLIVEMGATEKVFGNPTHPYTKMLLASVPQLHRKWDEVAKELEVSDDLLIDPDAAKRVYESVGEILAPDALDSVLVETESDHVVRYSPEEAKEKMKSPAKEKKKSPPARKRG
jgi:ABC-type oligopeptide transport system ATPase subunit